MTADPGLRDAPEPTRPATAQDDTSSIRPGEMAAGSREGGGAPAVMVRELIHVGVATATPETTLANAAAAMVRTRAGSVVVIQSSFLAGILTKWDVLRATASGADPHRSLVAEWMTPDPQSVSPDTPAEDAIRMMLQHGLHHLPVADGKQVHGVVRLRDLLAIRIRRPSARAAGPADTAEATPPGAPTVR
ncbi:MAG: cyclic nucleotide-binding/CBS domain-containing protein [Micromonosporaceae bacterium]